MGTIAGSPPNAQFQPKLSENGDEVGIQSGAQAETFDEAEAIETAGGLQRGGRVKRANKWYQSEKFWRHYDEDSVSDNE